MYPMVSIIVPVYNCQQWFTRCLDGLLAQTYSDWECILVDDGSKDESGAICDSYAAKDSRFKVIHQKNQGASAARNAGIKQVSGTYVLMLDADDTLSPLALELMMQEQAKAPDDFIFFRFTEELDQLLTERTDFESVCYSQKDAGKLYNDAPFPTPWGKLYHADQIRKTGLLFDVTLKCYEDRPFVLQYLRQFWQAHPTAQCRLIPLALYFYENGNENSLSKSDRSALSPKYWEMFDELLMLFWQEYKIPHTELHTIASEYLNTVLYGLWCTPKKDRRTIMRKFYRSSAYRNLMDFFQKNHHYDARYLPLKFHLSRLTLALNNSRLGDGFWWWKAHWLGWYFLGGSWYKI